jgi:hypothetical protein
LGKFLQHDFGHNKMNENSTKVIQMELDMALEVLQDFMDEVLDLAEREANDDEWLKMMLIVKAFRRVHQQLGTDYDRAPARVP